jgi:iron complex outermembrane receptor protein
VGFKAATGPLYYELAVFHINLDDELVPFELPASPGRSFYANAGESTRTGLEAAVSWNTSNGFGIDASLTWSDFTFDDFLDDNGNDYSGSLLPGVPDFFAYLGLKYEGDGGFKATFDTSYSGSLYANNANSVEVLAYVVSGLRATYESQIGSWLLRPYFSINNLFNEHYYSNIRINAFGARYYEPTSEQNFYAGIVVRFH